MSGIYYLAAVIVGLCLAPIVVWVTDRYVVALYRWEQATMAAIVVLATLAFATAVHP